MFHRLLFCCLPLLHFLRLGSFPLSVCLVSFCLPLFHLPHLDPSLLHHLLPITQGPLCQQALAALGAITSYVALCPEAATIAASIQQARQQQQQGGSAAAASSSEGLAAPAAAAAAAGSEPPALVACVMPQLDVEATLERVLDSCGAPAKKRKFKLLPFVGGGVGDAGRRFTDD